MTRDELINDYARIIDELRPHIADLEAKLAASQAGAAALRKALLMFRVAKLDDGPCWCGYLQEHIAKGGPDVGCATARAALASDAGRELLGELAKLRQLCDGYPRLLDAQKLAYESSASGTETLHKLDAMDARATALEEAAQVAEAGVCATFKARSICKHLGVCENDTRIAAAIRALATK